MRDWPSPGPTAAWRRGSGRAWRRGVGCSGSGVGSGCVVSWDGVGCWSLVAGEKVRVYYIKSEIKENEFVPNGKVILIDTITL